MRYLVLALLCMGFCVASQSGCFRVTDVEQDENPSDSLPGPLQNADALTPRMVIFDLYTNRITEPDDVQKYAKAELVILNDCNLWCCFVARGITQRLKAANPAIKVLNYTRSKTSMCDIDFETLGRDWHPYLYDWYTATRPYWCWTTEGDTLMDWPGEVVIDISQPGCRQAIIDVISYYQATETNKIDGVLWDYFPTQLFIVPAALENMVGEPDIDGDGISHYEDEDEREAFLAGQVALIEETRAALGEDFIQIFNGNRARTDSTFAALGDGILYERFPTVGFVGDEYMANALDPNQYNNLFAARNWPRAQNGGPWLILANKWSVGFVDDQGHYITYNLADINRVTALLTDCAVVYNPYGRWGYEWPQVELRLGPPLGGVVFEGQSITREFQRGRVTLTWTSRRHPLPFNFEIIQDGQVVQMLDLPRHLP
jgi:hypothetical protein